MSDEKVTAVETKTEFKPGDVVMIKAGGPIMMVESIRGDNNGVDCFWFKEIDRENNNWDGPHRDCFHPDCLMKMDDVEESDDDDTEGNYRESEY